MTTNRDWYNFPVYRTELDNMLAGVVVAALASGGNPEYMRGFLPATQAIATAAGLRYATPKITVEAPGRQLAVTR